MVLGQNMMLAVILALCALIALQPAIVMGQQQQQQQITLTREYVDALMQVISPTCSEELEAALTAQQEISQECRVEIQQGMQTLQDDPNAPPLPDQSQQQQQQQQRQQNFDQQDLFEQPASATTRGAGSGSSSYNVVLMIIGFVVTFFVGMAGIAFYINSARDDSAMKKPKKLSKKKEEKLRMKGGGGNDNTWNACWNARNARILVITGYVGAFSYIVDMASFLGSNEAPEISHADIENMLESVLQGGKIKGLDTSDNEYSSILTLWESELKPRLNKSSINPSISSAIALSKSTAEERADSTMWYGKAFDYWESETNCPITDDGVLGGYGKVTPMDARDSHAFLDILQQRHRPSPASSTTSCNYLSNLANGRAADCGAGIGRVARNVLLPRCCRGGEGGGGGKVDLVEQSPRLLYSAPKYLSAPVGTYPTDSQYAVSIPVAPVPVAPENAAAVAVTSIEATMDGGGDTSSANCVRLINKGLQDFAPDADTYDLIWIQWVIGHLHDVDCIKFFRRCAHGLTETGCIVLKDNCILDSDLTFLWDLEDSSVARNRTYLLLLIRLAGLVIVQESLQEDFPEELFPVIMLALARAPPQILSSSSSSSS